MFCWLCLDSSIQYLAERLPLPTIYQLQPPQEHQQQLKQQTSKKNKQRQNKTDIDDDEDEIENSLSSEFNLGTALSSSSYNRPSYVWSAWDICESFAASKNYSLKGSKGRFDTYRAANEILHDALGGQIVLNFQPQENNKQITKENIQNTEVTENTENTQQNS